MKMSDIFSVKKVGIDTLNIDPNNVRRHDEKNMRAIEKSIATFGQVEPLVVRKKNYVVIGGNGRLEALSKLGYTEVNIVELDIDAKQAKALAIALNRSAELAEWDMDGLREQLASLDDELADIAYEDFDFQDDFEYKDPGEDKSDSNVDSNKLTVTCESLQEKDKLFRELNDRGYKVK